MSDFIKSIPSKIEENLLLNYSEDENLYLISKLHPELRKLELNKVAKDILNFCDGDNDTNNIVKLILEKYTDVDRVTVESDVLGILHEFWRLGIIRWETLNPFEKEMIYNRGEITAKILTEEEAIEKINEKDSMTNPFYSEVYQLNGGNVRKKIYSGIEQFVEIRGQNLSVLFSLLYKGEKSKSCFLNFYQIEYDKFFHNNFKEILDWSIDKYQQFIKYRFHRVDVAITDKDTSKDIEKINLLLIQLNFQKTGCFKKAINEEDKYFDINLFSLNI